MFRRGLNRGVVGIATALASAEMDITCLPVQAHGNSKRVGVWEKD